MGKDIGWMDGWRGITVGEEEEKNVSDPLTAVKPLIALAGPRIVYPRLSLPNPIRH